MLYNLNDEVIINRDLEICTVLGDNGQNLLLQSKREPVRFMVRRNEVVKYDQDTRKAESNPLLAWVFRYYSDNYSAFCNNESQSKNFRKEFNWFLMNFFNMKVLHKYIETVLNSEKVEFEEIVKLRTNMIKELKFEYKLPEKMLNFIIQESIFLSPRNILHHNFLLNTVYDTIRSNKEHYLRDVKGYEILRAEYKFNLLLIYFPFMTELHEYLSNVYRRQGSFTKEDLYFMWHKAMNSIHEKYAMDLRFLYRIFREPYFNKELNGFVAL